MSLEAVFWLASYPKSGNTWARMLLNAYHFGFLDINTNANFTQYDTALYHYRALSPMDLDKMTPEQVLILRPAVILHLMAAAKFRPNVVKTHCANIVAGGVELIPNELSGGAVYIVRDPRDVVVSFAKHTGIKIGIAIAHMNERDNRLQNESTTVAAWLSTWSHHVKSWDVPGCVRIKYEDMKEDPHKEFSRILEAYKMPADEDKINKSVELCELDRLKKQEEENGFIELGKQEKFFGQGNGWQNELTENEVKKIEMDHGEVMEELGYKLEYL